MSKNGRLPLSSEDEAELNRCESAIGRGLGNQPLLPSEQKPKKIEIPHDARLACRVITYAFDIDQLREMARLISAYVEMFAPPTECCPSNTPSVVPPRDNRRHLTDDQKVRIVAMSADGKTQRDISESIGVCQATVGSVLKRHRAAQGD